MQCLSSSNSISYPALKFNYMSVSGDEASCHPVLDERAKAPGIRGCPGRRGFSWNSSPSLQMVCKQQWGKLGTDEPWRGRPKTRASGPRKQLRGDKAPSSRGAGSWGQIRKSTARPEGGVKREPKPHTADGQGGAKDTSRHQRGTADRTQHPWMSGCRDPGGHWDKERGL